MSSFSRKMFVPRITSPKDGFKKIKWVGRRNI